MQKKMEKENFNKELKEKSWKKILIDNKSTIFKEYNSKSSSQNIFYKQIPILEAVYDKLRRSLNVNLNKFIDDNDSFLIKSSEFLSTYFENYIHSVKNLGLVGVFKANEWNSEGLVFIEHSVALNFINTLSGGKKNIASNFDISRDYSKFEKKLIGKLINFILSDFSDVFDPLCKVTFDLKKIETDINLTPITKNTNAVHVAKHFINIGKKVKGSIQIVLPYIMLDPIKNLLVQNFMGEKFGHDNVWEGHILQQLLKSDMTLDVTLPVVKTSVGEILKWKIGNIVPFDCSNSSLLDASCEKHNVFLGKVGQKNKKAAFKIEKSFLKNNGEKL